MDWVSEAMSYLRDNRFTRISATLEAENAWVKHVNEDGANNGIPPEQAEVVFEGSDTPRSRTVEDIVWSSPPDRRSR